MRRQVRVHERFVVGPIPLGERGVDFPVILCRCFLEGAGGCEALVESLLEAFDFVDVVWKVVAGTAFGQSHS